MQNLQPQFEAITKIEKALEGVKVEDQHRILNFVQSGIYHKMEGQGVCAQPLVAKEEEMIEAEGDKPAPKKKATTKKATTKKKAAEPVVVPTLEEMMSLCRDTATRLKSADKVKALIKDACNVEAIKDANPDTFVALAKKLNDAK